MISSLRDAIKDNLLALYTQRLHRSKKRSALGNSKHTPMTIGFLYTDEPDNPEKTEAILRAAEKIKASGQQVHVLCYVPTQTKTPHSYFHSFTKQDINFWGRSKKKELSSFFKTRFEHLYYLNLTSEPILDYIIARCHARCKIATFIPGKMYLFEIIFKGLTKPGEKITFDNLLNKMLSYTQQLQV